jgi:probable F420-dependent oxidoreductase
MEFGLQISNIEWQALRDTAQMAEGLGFHSMMLPDHILYEGPERQSDPQHLAYDPILQAAVIAEATKKMRVGHLVLCNLFRHPWFTAQCISSVDHISGGRAFLGLGSGWTETEFRMTGIAFPDITTRLRMLDEALGCIRALWTQEHATFAGAFYQLKDAIQFPKPVQKPHPPIVLGGGGKGLLRIAAKHADMVNLISDVGKAGYIKLANTNKFTDASFKEKVRFLREEAARLGRDPQAIKISHVVFQPILTDSTAATQQMAENMAGMVGVSPDDIRRSPIFLIGTSEECVTELQRRAREWELSEVVFSWSLGEAGMRKLAQEVLPHV